MSNQTDPTAERLRREPTRLERLERPAPPPMGSLPPAPQPSAEAQATYAEINAREEAIRRPGPGR
jgi:hypothetical protein